MYKTIKVYINGKYVFSTRNYRTQNELRQRIRADKRIFVFGDGMKYHVVDVCDYDKITMIFA